MERLTRRLDTEDLARLFVRLPYTYPKLDTAAGESSLASVSASTHLVAALLSKFGYLESQKYMSDCRELILFIPFSALSQ